MAKKTKNKSKKAAIKRFKITASGKILHRSAGVRHLKSKKSKKQLRHLKQIKEISGVFAKKITKMLGK